MIDCKTYNENITVIVMILIGLLGIEIKINWKNTDPHMTTKVCELKLGLCILFRATSIKKCLIRENEAKYGKV